MSIVGSRVIKKVRRPEPGIVQLFRELAVADIADCMNKMGCMHSRLRPLHRRKLLGTAVTVKVPDGNNLMFHVALSLAQAGDVIVVDGGGYAERGICGENMVMIAKEKGIEGLVVDGAIRDSAAIAAVSDISLYACSFNANAANKGGGPGEVNVPISAGGVVVFPGDIIVGDEDGVVVVPPRHAVEIAQEARAWTDKQQRNLELIKQGTSDRSWVTEALEQSGIPILDKTWDE